MSSPSRLLALTGALLFGLGTAPMALAAHPDPSGRVARLSEARGEVSYSPAGEDEWVGVSRNRPLIRGDRLWTDSDGRAELQVGSAAIRLGNDTSFQILDLNDRITQIRLNQGSLNLRVRRIDSGQSFEVATPNLAFTVRRVGRYRIDVEPDRDQTTIVVWEGTGEANAGRSRFRVNAGESVRFYDDDLRDYEMFGLPRADEFDRYALARDQRLARSESLRYVDDDVVGYSDLDRYGSWRPVRNHGTVWFPSDVDHDWAPYRDGHWIWQEPWGWTWVDDAPWGFAPSHYGRWIHVSNRWGWVPGRRNVRPVYAPALVAFVGGQRWSLSISLGSRAPIGWFPLAPREPYVPSYRASRDYFTRVNVNNTVVNNTTINNVYNNYSSGTINVTQVNYANRAVAGAVTAVPSSVFVNAQPVHQAAIQIDTQASASGDITRLATIAPSARSVLGQAPAPRNRPSRSSFERQVVARNAPPPRQRSFAARETQLKQNPGRPPDPVAVEAAPGVVASTRPDVSVIAAPAVAVDARVADPHHEGSKPGKLQPLDRAARRRDRLVETQKQAADQQQVERHNQAVSDQKAADQQHAERQSKAENDQKAAKQQQDERQRQADAQRQAEVQQQEQRRQKDESDQKAAKQQQDERQRQADAQRQAEAQQQAQQQEQRRQKDEGDQKAAKQQQDERQRQADAQRQAEAQQQALLRAECERRAVEQKQDPGQCRTESGRPNNRGKRQGKDRNDERAGDAASPTASGNTP